MHLFLAHPFSLLLLYWAFSSVIGGMPEPDASSTRAYRWAFGSLHLLAGNINTAVQARYPALMSKA